MKKSGVIYYRKEVQEKLLPGELGVSPNSFYVPQRMGD